jgi:ribonuclease HI
VVVCGSATVVKARNGPDRELTTVLRVPLDGLRDSYGCESVALVLALVHAQQNRQYEEITILTDGLSVVQAIANVKNTDRRINRLKYIIKDLADGGMRVNLQFIRGHKGHTGNEMADVEAKAAAKASLEGALDGPICLQEWKAMYKCAEAKMRTHDLHSCTQGAWEQATRDVKEGRVKFLKWHGAPRDDWLPIEKEVKNVIALDTTRVQAKNLQSHTLTHLEEVSGFGRNPLTRNIEHDHPRRTEIFYNRLRTDSRYIACSVGTKIDWEKEHEDCPICGERLDAEHIFIKCKAFDQARESLEVGQSLHNLQTKWQSSMRLCRKIMDECEKEAWESDDRADSDEEEEEKSL